MRALGAFTDGHNILKHWNQPLDDNFLFNWKKNFKSEKNFTSSKSFSKLIKFSKSKKFLKSKKFSIEIQNFKVKTIFKIERIFISLKKF